LFERRAVRTKLETGAWVAFESILAAGLSFVRSFQLT